MDKLKLVKGLLLVVATVNLVAFIFTKNEANQYICFSTLMLLFGINATEDYKREKKRFSFFLAILCYAICLLQLVLFAGTLLQLQ